MKTIHIRENKEYEYTRGFGKWLSIDAAIEGFVYRNFREQNSIVLHSQIYTKTHIKLSYRSIFQYDRHMDESDDAVHYITWSIHDLPAEESMVHMTDKEGFSCECIRLDVNIRTSHFVHEAGLPNIRIACK